MQRDNTSPEEKLKIFLRGLPASPGVVTGVARVIFSPAEIGKIAKGEILVASETNPAYVPAMLKSSAIVTDRGGILSHAAIVARELGIPAVVGTMKATRLLKDGMEIAVDGNRGIVLKRREE